MLKYSIIQNICVQYLTPSSCSSMPLLLKAWNSIDISHHRQISPARRRCLTVTQMQPATLFGPPGPELWKLLSPPGPELWQWYCPARWASGSIGWGPSSIHISMTLCNTSVSKHSNYLCLYKSLLADALPRIWQQYRKQRRIPTIFRVVWLKLVRGTATTQQIRPASLWSIWVLRG